MEFNYKVTEAEYRKAQQLRFKGGFRFHPFKLFLYWLFILFCLILLWAIVQRGASRTGNESNTPQASNSNIETPKHSAPESSGDNAFELVMSSGALVVVSGVWIFRIFVLPRIRLHRLYWKDPLMQGQFTVNVTPTSFSTHNTAGSTSQMGWNILEYWRERKDLIVLVFHSGTYFIVSLAGLPGLQREELRGILSAALPKKQFHRLTQTLRFML